MFIRVINILNSENAVTYQHILEANMMNGENKLVLAMMQLALNWLPHFQMIPSPIINPTINIKKIQIFLKSHLQLEVDCTKMNFSIRRAGGQVTFYVYILKLIKLQNYCASYFVFELKTNFRKVEK